jgi:hypothetical protein
MNYRNLVTEDSFVGQYMRYMSDVETPEAYDFWCAIWAIGVCCGRTVFVDRPRLPVYLNWYIILAAESGTTRKSTAVRFVEKVVEPSRNNLVINTKVSPEGLVHNLACESTTSNHASCVIAVPELVTLLGKEGYLMGMPGLLTDLYDCPDHIDGRGKADGLQNGIKDVFISMLSASTPSWLVTAINPQVIEGGFTSRVIFVAADKRKKAIPWPTKDDMGYGEIRTTLNQITGAAKDIKRLSCGTGGLDTFKKWYVSRISHKDPYRSSFEAREDDHVLKLAACLSINDESFRLSSHHIRHAIRVIAEAKEGAYILFNEGSVNDLGLRLGDGIDLVKSKLINAGMDGLGHNRLYKSVRHKIDSKEFSLLMNVMHETGMIQQFEIKGTRGKIYRGTNHLESVGTTGRLLHQIAPG